MLPNRRGTGFYMYTIFFWYVSHHTRIAEIGQLGIWRKSITNTLSGSIQQKFKTLNLFFYRL